MKKLLLGLLIFPLLAIAESKRSTPVISCNMGDGDDWYDVTLAKKMGKDKKMKYFVTVIFHGGDSDDDKTTFRGHYSVAKKGNTYTGVNKIDFVFKHKTERGKTMGTLMIPKYEKNEVILDECTTEFAKED